MNSLVLIPHVRAYVHDNGMVSFPDKFTTGNLAFVERWNGPVKVIVQPGDDYSPNLDNEDVDPKALPFELVICDYQDPAMASHLHGSGVAVGGMDCYQSHLSSLASTLRVPFVNVSEYTLKTRKQIVAAETPNIVRRWRRVFWEYGQERRNIQAIQASVALQCNGLPTYKAYQSIIDDRLLYFDTRVREKHLIDKELLDQRLARLLTGEPLRLAFSGRLDPMKGVQYLLPLAKALRERNMHFTLTIYGDGTLKKQLSDELTHNELRDCVALPGVFDFETQLLPVVKSEVDLFVCPHVQGDPACTYLETLSCGVPVVGFDNEALAGLSEVTDSVVSSPMKNTAALADQIEGLNRDRERLALMSREALAFAKNHTMEKTFDTRVEHLQSVADKYRS